MDPFPRRLRRDHAGYQPQERLREIAVGRAVEIDLGTGKQNQDLEGHRRDLAGRNIILYSPDNDSGTFEFFTEAIVGKAKSQRDDVQPSSDDNTLVNGVAGDADGMGYFGYAYFANNQDKLRAVAIQNGAVASPVLPSPATIADKTYTPLSRPLYIYVKNSAAKRPEVAKFLKYYVENLDQLATKALYDPPTAEDKAANLETLNELLTGGAGLAKSTAKVAE